MLLVQKILTEFLITRYYVFYFQGDPLYSEFWNRVKNNPEETVYNSVKEGLDLLKNEQAIIHIESGRLKGFFKENPHYTDQNLNTFGRGQTIFTAIIVPINSPLKPIFQKMSNHLIEAGTMDHLKINWEGMEITQIGSSDFTALSVGQVVLIFVIIILFFGFSFFIFLGEIVHSHSKKIPLEKKSEVEEEKIYENNA